jgi:hypothetical protein
LGKRTKDGERLRRRRTFKLEAVEFLGVDGQVKVLAPAGGTLVIDDQSFDGGFGHVPGLSEYKMATPPFFGLSTIELPARFATKGIEGGLMFELSGRVIYLQGNGDTFVWAGTGPLTVR